MTKVIEALRRAKGRRVVVVTPHGTYAGTLEEVDHHMNVLLRDAVLLSERREVLAKVGTVVVRGSYVVALEAEVF